MKRRLTLIAGALAAAMMLSACGGNADPTATPEPENHTGDSSVLTVGVAGGSSFNPADMIGAGEGLMVWHPVYDTLLQWESDGSIIPGLATDWEFDEARTTITLTLRDGVTFTDGTPVDADAVVANIEHFLANPGETAMDGALVAGATATDDTTVEIALHAPDATIEMALTGPLGVVVNPSALGTEDLDLTPAGSGPYVLNAAETEVGSRLVFDRREGGHWNEDAWAFDRIVMLVMPDEAARINALRAGQIDGARITAAAAAEVESAGMTVLSSPGEFVGLGLWDTQGTIVPALADVRVRQAINYALDREAMLDAVALGHGVLPERLFGDIEPVDGIAYTHDVERARELMAEAGYADGFTMSSVDLGTGSPLNAIVSAQLAEIGIELTWEPVAAANAIAEMFSGRFPVLITPYGTGPGGNPGPMLRMVNTASPWNVFSNTDPELEALIAEVNATTGEAQRDALGRLDGWLSRNAWFAPFYQWDHLYAISDSVTAEPFNGNATPLLRTFRPVS